MWATNWLAVIAAAASGFIIGGLWYGPLFRAVWQRESGVTDAMAKAANTPRTFALVFLLNLTGATMLGHALSAAGSPPLRVALMISGGIGALFIGTALGVNYLFSGRSLKHWLIDTGYWTLIYLVMGTILTLWR